jgi:hypothetical protein
MDIYLSTNDRKQLIKLPILPSEFTISSPSQNETYTTITQGDIKLIGPAGLKAISLQTFFPYHRYSFSRDSTISAWKMVGMIENWKALKIPIRLVIVDPNPLVNMLCAIENFEYGLKDGSKDVYYTLSLSEFKMVPLTKRKV